MPDESKIIVSIRNRVILKNIFMAKIYDKVLPVTVI